VAQVVEYFTWGPEFKPWSLKKNKTGEGEEVGWQRA
jgi:hypothetical protein